MSITMASFELKMDKGDCLKALYNLFDFDSDWNGTNGTEYLKEEALEEGCEDNLTWFINDNIDLFLNTNEVFNQTEDDFLTNLESLCENYLYLNRYSILEVGVLKVENGYVASLFSRHELKSM